MPPSSAATPSSWSFTGTTVAVTPFRLSASARLFSVVVPGMTATRLPPSVGTSLTPPASVTSRLPPSMKVSRLKSTCSCRDSDGGGRAALEIDGALDDLVHPVGHRHLDPRGLQIGHRQLLGDAGGHEGAQLHRVARRLAVVAGEREGAGGLAVPEADGVGGLDLLQRAVEVRRPGGASQGQREHGQQQHHPSDHDRSFRVAGAMAPRRAPGAP